MRLLFLSNFFPPHGYGGYEQWCQEVAEGLVIRGHKTLVLTSQSRQVDSANTSQVSVQRQLFLEMELASWRNMFLFFTNRRRRECANLNLLRHQIADFAPDAILVWGMWNLSRALPALAEQLYPERTLYYFGDYWPTLPSQWRNYWRVSSRNRLASIPKRLLRFLAEPSLSKEKPLALRFSHALFPSEFMQRAYAQAGVAVGHAQVVPGGVDTRRYTDVASQRLALHRDDPLRLLVVGRLTPDKGIHTAIQALAILSRQSGVRDVRLTIVGSGERAYRSKLQRLTSELGVGGQIEFLDAVPKAEMPALYARHDIFIFPSVWDEPFGRVLVEAMASGMTVVGTTVGGAGEILRDGETGLVFLPEDASNLATVVDRLAGNCRLRSRLAQQGRIFSVTHFDIDLMTNGIEQYLRRL